jgi:hypothetical protein
MPTHKLAVGRNDLFSKDALGSVNVNARCRLTAGHTYCASHTTQLADDLTRDAHLAEASDHWICWLCDVHGPEALS